MTSTTILDFDISTDGRTAVVFDARTGADIGTVSAARRELTLQAAVRFIAERTPGTRYVLQNRVGFIMWSPEAKAWAPLPLTTAATRADADAFVLGLPSTAGRSVHVVSAV